MKDKVPFPYRQIILVSVFALTTILVVGFQIFSVHSVESSLGFSTQSHITNRMDKMPSFSEPKSTFDKSRISGRPTLSTGNFVYIPNNDSNEKYIEAPEGRIDSDKNVSRILSTQVSRLVSLPVTSAERNSLRPAAPSLQTSALSHDIVYVPAGVSVPAVLAEPSAKSALDPISQEEVHTMADTFLSNVDEQVRAGTSRDAAWKQLQNRSDDVFRARYGWEAFNRESASANEQATVPH